MQTRKLLPKYSFIKASVNDSLITEALEGNGLPRADIAHAYYNKEHDILIFQLCDGKYWTFFGYDTFTGTFAGCVKFLAKM